LDTMAATRLEGKCPPQSSNSFLPQRRAHSPHLQQRYGPASDRVPAMRQLI